MKMKKSTFALFSALIILQHSAEASLFMMNDSPFKMKATIMAANGTNLGEKVLEPQESGYFEDSLGQSDPTGQHQTPYGNTPNSMTPYTVFWYCMSGTSYSTCTNVAAGALVTPGQCDGAKYCKPPKQSQQQTPSNGDSDYSDQDIPNKNNDDN